MKILVFGFSSQRGGVESFLLTFCREMAKQSPTIEFDFVFYDEVPAFANCLKDIKSNFLVLPSRMHHPIKNLACSNKLFRQKHYDYLWFNVCTLSDVTLLKIANRCGVPAIVHAHNSENMGNIVNGFLHYVHRSQLKPSHNIYFACSDLAAKYMFPGEVVQSNRYVEIRNGIKAETFCYSEFSRTSVRERYGIKGEYVIGNVGRFHPQKNHSFLIDVFYELVTRGLDCKLLLLGNGELMQEIKNKVSDLGLSKNVIFAGEVDNSSPFYSAMDCFVFPSLYEGFGLAALEAQASGLPCVISDNAPASVVVSDRAIRMSLGLGPSRWADAIEKICLAAHCERKEGVELVKKRGLAVEDSVKMVLRCIGENSFKSKSR